MTAFIIMQVEMNNYEPGVVLGDHNLSDLDMDPYLSHDGHTPVRSHPVQPIDDSRNTTPVRPRLPQTRYPPYFAQNYMFPDHVAPARASTEKLLGSVVESQKKMMALVEGVSSRIAELEKVVTDMNAKSADSVSTTSTEEKKRIPSQLSVSSILTTFQLC